MRVWIPEALFRTAGCSLPPRWPSEKWPKVFLMQPYFRANGSLNSGCWLWVFRVPAGWRLSRLVLGSVFRRVSPELSVF